jgi:hypothetical protein
VTAVSPAPRLTRGVHLGYALGSIGTAAFGTVPGLLLLHYLTDVLGVAAGTAGVGGGRLPERMAPVHALVAALPRPVAERLLSGVLEVVYRPISG